MQNTSNMKKFLYIIKLISECADAEILQMEEDNVLVWRKAGTEYPEGWYLENIFSVARELMNDLEGVKLLENELENKTRN